VLEEPCRPYRTVFEPTKDRDVSGKRLLDLLLEHYEELERLLDRTSHDISIDGDVSK